MPTIQQYKESDKPQIKKLLQEIASEFEIPISNKNKSTSQLFDKYWVASNNTEIIGTVAVYNIKNKYCILKAMFVKKEFRGKEIGIANLLLQTVNDWCKIENIKSIYLGTMNQFKAAQKFYEQNGFQQIEKDKLPSNFINNSIDDIYYLYIRY